MTYKKFLCEHCNHTFTLLVGEAVLRAVCPSCGRLAKLIRFGVNLGLSLGESVFAVVLGYTLYKLLRSD